VKSNKKLVACVFGVPIDLRIRTNTFQSAEVNYLCVHRKLRNKRLAPTMIKEITRRFNQEGIFQAIYTAGIVLPSPVSTCRYYHRTLDFDKLYEVGFSRLPQGITPTRQRLRFKLPDNTNTPGFREMGQNDIAAVGELLARYLQRFDMAQVFSIEEIDHWLLHRMGAKSESDRVVWTYVVETNGKITDFVSFYKLESSILKQTTHKHKVIRAAYLYYYATEAAFDKDQSKLKTRLNELMRDALIVAKKVRFHNAHNSRIPNRY
jgi:glycylpeptide N-tetradecanoyltransferase